MEKYFEINKNGNNIRCKLYADAKPPFEKVVLYVHGFAGHKETGAAKRFAERVLRKQKNVAIVTFDLPGHGKDVKKKISLNDCLTYISCVAEYIKNELNASKVYSYATSFGGYLVLKYISEYGNPFEKTALRCPAVNMADVMKNTIAKKDDFEKLRKGKSVAVGFDRKVEVSPQLFAEIEDNDIRRNEYLDFADDILILHGTKDEVVPFEESEKFCDDNCIEFVSIENADHRFQNPSCMEAATKKILDFFELL